MDNLENKPAPQPDANNLQEQLNSLQHLVVSVLVLVIVVSGTLNIYLLRQYRSAKSDLTMVRPQVTQMVADYNKTTGPLIGDFIKRLTEYGRSHPDFVPILAKYGISTTAPSNAVPAKPAPAKK